MRISRTHYICSYVLQFTTTCQKQAAYLAGPDNMIGDQGACAVSTDTSGDSALVFINRFGTTIGSLSQGEATEIASYFAKQWTVIYILNEIRITNPKTQEYTVNVSLVAFDPRYQQRLQPALDILSSTAQNGTPREPRIGDTVLKRIDEGTLTAHDFPPLRTPPHSYNDTIIKDHLTLHDRIIEGARNATIGTIICSWIALIALLYVCFILLRKLLF